MGDLLQVNVRQMQLNSDELQLAQQKIRSATSKDALTVSQVKRIMLGIDLHVDDMRRYFLQYFSAKLPLATFIFSFGQQSKED